MPIEATSRAVPSVSGGWPLIGHTLEFLKGPVELLSRAQAEHGELVRMRVAHMDLYLFTGTEANEAYFRAPDEQFSQSAAYRFMTPVFGKDIAYDAAPGKMAEQLSMLLPALRIQSMEAYGEIIADEVLRITADWGDEGVIDLVEFTKGLTNLTSTRCLLGDEFREQLNDEFARVYHDLERGITALAYINPYLPLPVFRRRDRARVRLEEMITTIVDKRRADSRAGVDFLQTLMESSYRDGTPLSAHEITGMLLAAMFAGHHTSSVTTAWTLLELLRAPDYLGRVRAEVDHVIGDEAPDYETLRELGLVENAVKEALRLHPPLVMLMRKVMREFRYKDFAVPRGAYVLTSPAVTHRIESEFPNPGAFDPDRFGPGRKEDANPFRYIAFGAGRHKCMGNAFAILQVKTILAMLLRRYDFELVGDPFEPEYQSMVVGPKQPNRVRYRIRHIERERQCA